VVLLLFGSTRLPGAADALGKSMHIFKRSVKGLGDDDQPADGAKVTQATALPPTAAPQPLAGQSAPADATQQQLLDMQRQIQELQRQAGGATANGAMPTETQHTQQPF
jgi:sec-independent protein translocase protein TatA